MYIHINTNYISKYIYTRIHIYTYTYCIYTYIYIIYMWALQHYWNWTCILVFSHQQFGKSGFISMKYNVPNQTLRWSSLDWNRPTSLIKYSYRFCLYHLLKPGGRHTNYKRPKWHGANPYSLYKQKKKKFNNINTPLCIWSMCSKCYFFTC